MTTSSTKTWDCMPNEMKQKFMEHLDIKNRMNFRLVSKNDKEMIDSRKFVPEESVALFGYQYFRTVHLIYDGKYKKFNVPLDCDKLSASLEYLMSHAKFKKLNVDDERGIVQMFRSQIHVEELEIKCRTPELLHQWLEKLDGSTKILNLDFDDFPIEEFFENEKFTDVHVLETCPISTTDSVHRLAQMWIRKNAEIGRKFKAEITVEGWLEEFSQVFADRLVDQREHKVTIKIDESKYIVVREFENERYHSKYVYMIVASAETTKDSDADEILFDSSLMSMLYCIPHCSRCNGRSLKSSET